MDEDKCYQMLTKFSLFNRYFAFLDTEEYLADGLFIQHEVTVHFGPEYEKPGSPYRMILCRVRKRDEDRALAALEELLRKMLLCGHMDYPAFCRDLWSKLRTLKGGALCDDADGAAGQAE